MIWDVFVSHASEDKETVAMPLCGLLEGHGLRVWLDEAQLRVGDSLRRKIDEGLTQSRYGIVVLSKAFFAKEWPQRELDGLLAREDIDGKTILPIWHEISKADVVKFSPTLADRIAVPTDGGLERVCDKILDATGLGAKRTDSELAGRYSSDFDFPMERVARCRLVLESMCSETTWAHLAVERDGWMGSASSTLVDVLYDLMAPLVLFRFLSYGLRRSLSVFTNRARFQFGLLDSALNVIFNDADVAALSPSIAYTPRVPDWRSKRKINPQRYWWQGISIERFDEAGRFFGEPANGNPSLVQLVSVQDFRKQYRIIYESFDRKAQQAVGLLANPLYGFSPAERPVYWRLLVILGRIYEALLGNTTFDPQEYPSTGVDAIFHPKSGLRFPYTLGVDPSKLFEPSSSTFNASSRYIDAFVLPKLRLYLESTSE
jgi:hypothetical protein